MQKLTLMKINHMAQDTVIQLWRKTALSQLHGLEKIWASTTLCSDMEGTIQKLKKLVKLQCLNYIVKCMMQWLALLQTMFMLTSVTWNSWLVKKPLQKLVLSGPQIALPPMALGACTLLNLKVKMLILNTLKMNKLENIIL